MARKHGLLSIAALGEGGEDWGSLCLALRLPNKRRTIRLKGKANKPLATGKDQRSTPHVCEGASKLQSLLSLEPWDTNWFHEYERMAGTACLAKSPGHKTPGACSHHCLQRSNPHYPAHPCLAPCPKPNASEPHLLRSCRHRR